ncbi:MAG: hypothetical protein PHI37_00520 [Candidatus Gracilibacteria bacterium]|nr:hypothetical protein [Candidatus Gracilibacteria bacterium]
MKEISKVQKFMSEKIRAQRKILLNYTLDRVPWELGLPNRDDVNELIFIDENGNITRDGGEFLLDEFSPEGERENLSWDQGYYNGYVDGLNDVLRFLNN